MFSRILRSAVFYCVTVLLSSLLSYCRVASADTTLDDQVKHIARQSWQRLNDISQQTGARPAGSASESRLFEIAAHIWPDAREQQFSFSFRNTSLTSRNRWLTLPGQNDRHVIIGAHADSAGADLGSVGATDNGIAVALLLTLAETMIDNAHEDTLTFILFGAEEVGLQGSQAFVAALEKQALLENLPAPTSMINLDTIAGGDHLYIHSPTQLPYKDCPSVSNFNPSAKVRDVLYGIAQEYELPFQLHPAYPEYPMGETGGWSDHAPFACAGIPIAYIESTNFSIHGQDGYDGYSQGLHPRLWDCLNQQDKTACNRESETQWGRIWHTGADQLTVIESLYPGRLERQLAAVSELLFRYLTSNTPNKE